MKKMILVFAICLIAAAAAFADIARPDPTKTPKPPKGVNTSMEILLDRNAADVRLIIPKSQLKQLKAELDQLEDGADDTAAVTAAPSFSRTQTIVSGSFLSLALVFGGMWFVRSGKLATRSGKMLGAIALAAAAGSAATIVYANAGPPQVTSITGKIFNKDAFRFWGSVRGKIRLETSNESSVRMIVPDPTPVSAPGGQE